MKKNNLDTLDTYEKETLATLLQTIMMLHVISCETDGYGLWEIDLINVLSVVKKLNLRINIDYLNNVSQKITTVTHR